MSYHVFLSFRGEDTGNTFTAHLYTALMGAGFRTFLDDDGIDRGSNIKLALDKAINEARSSIIVLSKNYASSGWCLDELMMILNRKRTSSEAGHFVLPIFYHVDPSQVRQQTGDFGEVLRKHEERLICAETNEIKKECLREKLQGWRRALTEVASLAGEPHLADGNESEFIQQIVRIIQKSVDRPNLHVAHYLVGLEYRAANINSWLQDESVTVGIAMIYGMGGIGKTTFAKFAYNLNAGLFEACSFLADIRENSNRRGNVVCFQKQLLSDILKKEEKIRNVDEGISKIKDVICCKRVLLVLDDVDHRAQFDALIGKRDWFHPGSKIILTTRDSHLLMANEVDKTFELKELEYDEPLKLFSWHAFRESDPIEGYTELSKRVVQNCGGLPLALKVLGSYLSTHSSNIWENTIQKLAAIPNSEILEKLKISYDCLDDRNQQLFLHIACFFIGKSKDFIVRILGDFYPIVGIQTLIQRCLLTVNGNKLMMHQLLQQMGIEIVRQESPDDPGKCSRLCHHKDTFEVLSEKTGSETIKGIYLDSHHLLEEDNHHVLEKDSRFRGNIGVSNVKRFRSQEHNHEQGYSRKQHCNSSSIWCPTNNGGRSAYYAELTTDAFTRMHNLKLLLLNNVDINGSYANFPRGLRYLSWHGFLLTSIPTEFSLQRLVGLDLRYSKLEQVWKEETVLASLKILNLSHCHGLKNTPKFTWLRKLEKLVLKYCISLVEIDESIGNLESLVFLNLKGCKNLKKLPRGIGNLISLEKLILSGCSKLDQLPVGLGQMKSLIELHANGIFQETSLLWSLASPQTKNPKTLPLPGSLKIRRYPNILGRREYLRNCNLSSVADCLGSLSSLIKLDLRGNPMSSLPESIKGLTKLERLRLSKCTRLKSMPELPMTLTSLKLNDCRSLKTMKNLPNLRGDLILDLTGSKLVEVQGMFKLEPIRNANAEIINELGLSSELETTGNFEVGFYNPNYDWYSGTDEEFCNPTVEKGTIQVLYECGIHSIFLPRSNVPTGWWSSIKRMGRSITFHVPPLLNLQIQALKIYVVFESSPLNVFSYPSFVHIMLNNMTKGMKWSYTPWFSGTPPDKNTMDMVWIIYWKMMNQFLLEAGDEVNVSAGYIDDSYDRSERRVKEIGVHVVYDEVAGEGSQHHEAYSHHQNVTNVEDLSAYQLTPGHYNLCNYDNLLTNWSKKQKKMEILFGELEDSDCEDSDCES